MDIPSSMRAVQYDAYGSPAVLRVRRVPVPSLRPDAVLVQVAASSVNAADVAVRSGSLRLLSGRRFPRGTGFDFAGRVAALGDRVTGLQIGDRVWGFRNALDAGPTGATAEYVLAPVTAVAEAPVSVDDLGAAALSGVGGSALGVLRDDLALHPGDRVLIRGAAGGVGSTAVQIAHALGGRVTALARAGHLPRLRDLGAEQVYDYQTTDPADLGGFDVILDPVGRGMRPFRRLLSRRGRMAALTLSGPGQVLYLAASFAFGARRVRFARKPPDGALLADLAHLVDQKSLTPVIAAVHKLDDAAAAHLALETGGGFGKHIIRIT